MFFEHGTFETPGLIEILPKIFEDERGFFFESFSEKDFLPLGICHSFVQDNVSISKNSVFRGFHFQKKHPQAKLVQCLSGMVLDLALDLRETSPSFKKITAVVLDSKKHNSLYIPKGFAHGFLSLCDNVFFSYKCSDYYHKDDEGGISIESPIIKSQICNKICSTKEIIISQKDKNLPLFQEGFRYFDMDGNWIGN